MYPRPMTNDPDRVAPDHPIHLPGPTLVRPRRHIAAGVLSLLLAVSCFATSPTWAYKAGTGANDAPSWGIPKYETLAQFIAEPSSGHVKIEDYFLDGDAVKAFYKDKTTLRPTQKRDRLIKPYSNVNAYITDTDPTRATRLYADIGGKVYIVNELEDRHTTENPLSESNLPNPLDNDRLFGTVAVGWNARAGRPRAIAIGDRAYTEARRTVTIGHHSHASASMAVALGYGSRARGRHSIALGDRAHTQGVSSTALGHLSHAQGTSSTALGARSRAPGAYSTALGYASFAEGTHSIALGHGVVASGAYSIALGGPGLATSGAHGAHSIAVGINALASGTDSIALGQGALVNGNNGIAIGWRASAGANEVVIGTKGGTHTTTTYPHTTYKLPGLAPPSGTRVVTVDSNGRLSTQSTTAGTASSRGGALRGAAELSSGVTALDRGLGTPAEAADYEKAPAIGSGPTAPATAEQRRVVVQDTNRDGSVRLRTLDLGDLSGLDRRLAGVDQRVTSLSERLNKATAMSSALSALPNVVPGDNRFFLGVGVGHYSSEQALAVGMSARIQSRVFVNAGVALASGDDVSVRGGVGVVW